MNNDDNKQLNNEAPVEEIKEDAENVEVVPEEQVGIIKEVDLNREMKTSFLSYAMSVIVSRALPDVRDGMKPVHRIINSCVTMRMVFSHYFPNYTGTFLMWTIRIHS